MPRLRSVASSLGALPGTRFAFSYARFSWNALILKFYGISIPVLRVAGGFIVAVAGWKLLSEGSHKELEASADGVSRTELLDQAFYPLTLAPHYWAWDHCGSDQPWIVEDVLHQFDR